MKNVAVIDFSWEMHREREALSMLSITRTLPNGYTCTVPTGHVYGSYNDIKALAKEYPLVVLAIDSPCRKRRELLSQYKSDRHTPTGDPLKDYNIYNDLVNLLKLCTSIPNVFYVKEEDMEADDIIASFILDSDTNTERNYHIYMRDKDILQTAGRYVWYDKLTGAPVNREQYIMHVTGFEGIEGSDFDYFPLAVKIITGDTSDKIPNAVPRFPKKNLYNVCSRMPRNDFTFESFLEAFRAETENLNSTWKNKLKDLSDNNSDLVKALRLNYDMVCPIHKPVSSFKYKQLPQSVEETINLLDYYQIKHEELDA